MMLFFNVFQLRDSVPKPTVFGTPKLGGWFWETFLGHEISEQSEKGQLPEKVCYNCAIFLSFSVHLWLFLSTSVTLKSTTIYYLKTTIPRRQNTFTDEGISCGRWQARTADLCRVKTAL